VLEAEMSFGIGSDSQNASETVSSALHGRNEQRILLANRG
jgi:hypothetical protein